MKKALFLDRDGVINIDHGYTYRIEDFEFMPGILDLCRRFFDKGYCLIIVTNQSGIGRGYYTEADFHLLTDWLKQQFADKDTPLAGVYYCPHHPDDNCDCRKPKPGMLLQANDELNLDMAASTMIGDKPSDMQAAHAAGVGRKILLSETSEIGVESDIAFEQVERLALIQV